MPSAAGLTARPSTAVPDIIRMEEERPPEYRPVFRDTRIREQRPRALAADGVHAHRRHPLEEVEVAEVVLDPEEKKVRERRLRGWR